MSENGPPAGSDPESVPANPEAASRRLREAMAVEAADHSEINAFSVDGVEDDMTIEELLALEPASTAALEATGVEAASGTDPLADPDPDTDAEFQHDSKPDGSDGRTTADNDSGGVSRRSLLAGLTAIGGTSVLAGARTRGFLSDAESFGGDQPGGVFTTGEVDLQLAWQEEYRSRDGSVETATSDGSSWEENCPTGGFGDDPPPSFTLAEDLQPGDSGVVRIGFDGATNPGRLWGVLSTACADGILSGAVDATVTFGRCDGGFVAEPIYVDGEAHDQLSGTLCQVLRTLARGVRFGEDCLSTDGVYRLDIEWEFGPIAEGSTDDYEDEAVEFGFDFHYVQCRHNETPSNPFGGQDCVCPERYAISYIEIYAFEDAECSLVGKLELLPPSEGGYCDQSGIDGNYIDTGIYDLYPDGDSCDQETPYDVQVTATREKGSGDSTETTAVAFELLHDDSEPQLCRVDIFGATRTVTYASASDFDGNATAGLLDAPLKTTGGDDS